jgi:hypothetical protein
MLIDYTNNVFLLFFWGDISSKLNANIRVIYIQNQLIKLYKIGMIRTLEIEHFCKRGRKPIASPALEKDEAVKKNSKMATIKT